MKRNSHMAVLPSGFGDIRGAALPLRNLALVVGLLLWAISPLAATGLAESPPTPTPSAGADPPQSVIRAAVVRVIDDGSVRDDVEAFVRALNSLAGPRLRVERVSPVADARADSQIELLERAATDDLQAVVLVPVNPELLVPYAALLSDQQRLVTFGGALDGVTSLDPDPAGVAGAAAVRARIVIAAARRRRSSMVEVATGAGVVPPRWLGNELGLERGRAVRLTADSDAATTRMRSLLVLQPELILVHGGDAAAVHAAITAINALAGESAARVIADRIDSRLAAAGFDGALAGMVVPDLPQLARAVRELAREGALPDTAGAAVFVDESNVDEPEIRRLLSLW